MLECKLSFTQAYSAQAAQGLQSSCMISRPLSDRETGCTTLPSLASRGNKGHWQQKLRISCRYTLQDMREYGRKKGWCPYFLARHMLAFANVMVYNYQYMLDPKVRKCHHASQEVETTLAHTSISATSMHRGPQAAWRSRNCVLATELGQSRDACRKHCLFACRYPIWCPESWRRSAWWYLMRRIT